LGPAARHILRVISGADLIDHGTVAADPDGAAGPPRRGGLIIWPKEFR
jgi:hypothetical protein